MFDNLQDKMDRVFKTLRGEATLNEWHIDNALKEIRVALLEADVHFKTVKEFTNRVREKAVGGDVLTAFSPAQQVTKIVRDELQNLLGGNEVGLALVGSPAVIMMVGLQGSGKTTTSGKLALHLKNRGRRPLLVPADVYRPAAIDQLRIVANNVKVPFFEIGDNRNPVEIAQNALREAKTLLYDTVILDTAGRLHIDDELMQELQTIKNDARPSEILFVADAMTGQDAVKSAQGVRRASRRHRHRPDQARRRRARRRGALDQVGRQPPDQVRRRRRKVRRPRRLPSRPHGLSASSAWATCSRSSRRSKPKSTGRKRSASPIASPRTSSRSRIFARSSSRSRRWARSPRSSACSPAPARSARRTSTRKRSCGCRRSSTR